MDSVHERQWSEDIFYKTRGARTREGPYQEAKFACVGPSTQKALDAEGFKATVVPEEFLTKSLRLELVKRFSLQGKKVLLARSENANPDIALILRNAGAIVVEAAVYKTTYLKRDL